MIVDVSNDGFTIFGRFLVELNIEPGSLWVRSEKMGIERFNSDYIRLMTAPV